MKKGKERPIGKPKDLEKKMGRNLTTKLEKHLQKIWQ